MTNASTDAIRGAIRASRTMLRRGSARLRTRDGSAQSNTPIHTSLVIGPVHARNASGTGTGSHGNRSTSDSRSARVAFVRVAVVRKAADAAAIASASAQPPGTNPILRDPVASVNASVPNDAQIPAPTTTPQAMAERRFSRGGCARRSMINRRIYRDLLAAGLNEAFCSPLHIRFLQQLDRERNQGLRALRFRQGIRRHVRTRGRLVACVFRVVHQRMPFVTPARTARGRGEHT